MTTSEPADMATAAQSVIVQSAHEVGEPTPDADGKTKQRSRSQFADMWRRFRRNKLAMVGLVVVGILVLLSLIQPIISPYDPWEQNLLNTLATPDSDHLMGTDSLGRDLYSELLYGLKLALIVGICTMLGSLIVGVALGAIAGFRGRASDAIIMRVTDIFLAFPYLIGAILIVRTFGSGVTQVIVALVVLGWATGARLMRGQMLALREAEYVEAARSIGASDWRIVVRHILPNAIQPVFIYSFTSIGVAVVAMASLAYLGVGVPPDTPEWGRLINQGIEQVQVTGKDYLWIFPSAAICLTTLAFAFVADGLRDSLDPKLR
jgi:peptide/nickel transport system permease protein